MAKKIKPPKSKMAIEQIATYRPSIHLDEKQLPEIKNWKVGNKYELCIEVEMTSHSKSEYNNGAYSAEFKINKVESDKDEKNEK